MSSSLSNAIPSDSMEPLVEAQAGELVELPTEEKSARASKRERRSDATYHGIMLGLCLTVLVLSSLLTVRDGRQVLMPILGEPLPELCHMKRYTGIDCPGCGLTRSFISLAHGRVLDAWRYNPGAFVLFPLMLVQIPYRSLQIWRLRRGLPAWEAGWYGRGAMGAVVIVLVGQWILRQLGVGL